MTDVERIVSELGVWIVREEGTVRAWAREAIAGNPEAVAQHRAGRPKAFGALFGAMMRSHGERLDPEQARRLLASELDEAAPPEESEEE